MNRLRFLDCKDAIARVANTDTTDPRVLSLANESHRRLVQKGRWLGTMQRYRICTSVAGCLTWPRQVETVEAYWRCDTPGTVRNGWYEASMNSPGLLDSDDAQSNTLVDRSTACCFEQPDNNVSTIMVQASVSESTGSRILLRGYDENAAWIRSQDPLNGNAWIDGEYVTISSTPVYSVHKFTSLTEVVKPVTNGPVRLWQYDTSLALVTKQLAYYEPDETLPIYRQSLIPGLGNIHGCGNNANSTSCQSNTITIAAKLRHIDAQGDADFYLLGNLGAIKLMVMAILKEERNLFEESMAYESKAVRELQDELNSFEGNGQVPTIKTESPETWGANVMNPVTLGYRVY